MIKLLIVSLLLFVTWQATFSFSVSSDPGQQVTSCTGCCCTNGFKTVTTPQSCSTLDGFQGLFTNCSSVTCPPSTVITVIKGCTIINQTGFINGVQQPTITTYWGYSSISNVNIMLPVGVYDLFVNAMGYTYDAGQPQVNI